MTFSILAALLFLAPITTESGRFNILQDGKRIGTEEFTITARNSGYLVEGKTQLVGVPTPLTSRMELDDKLNPTFYEFKQGTGSLKIKIASPLSELTTNDGRKDSSSEFRFPAGGFIVDNNFFHHFLVLLYKVNAASTTIPIFVPQDMRVGQAIVRLKGIRTYELEMGDVRLEATTDANGRLMRLTVPAAKVVIER